MFARVVEITTKSGKARDVSSTINEKILPLLRNQTGFVDEITLLSSTEPNRILALSFWKSQEDAERYNREQFPRVQELVRNLVESEPRVQTFNVDTSTVHRIGAGKAA
jgi:quinol monooxygenase YgiN